MTAETTTATQGHVVHEAPALWFLGTLARVKLTGEQTGGRFALWESELPRGAAPPLHSHPQDETFYMLDGEISAWLVEEPAGADWAADGQTCRAGAVVHAPGGMPHTFRVESDTARVLVISTPAGIENLILGLGERAEWPWLQPPPDGPRVPAERRVAVERETGMVIHGPPPPSRGGAA